MNTPRDLLGRPGLEDGKPADAQTISGLASPYGGPAWDALDGPATFEASLIAWRRENGPIIRQELRISRPCSLVDFDPLVAEFEAWRPIRLSVLLQDGDPPTKATLLKIEGDARDSELDELAIEISAADEEERANPLTHDDTALGRLVFNPLLGWFEGKTIFDGRNVTFSFEISQGSERDAAKVDSHAAYTRAVIADLNRWESEARTFACDQLLELKNDVWLDEDEAPLTAAQFGQRMTLDSLVLFNGGSIDFYFDDGDLFLGHTIVVSGSSTDGLTAANIAG